MSKEIPIDPLERVKTEIVKALGYDSAQPPVSVPRSEAARALGQQPGTLAVWACTGRRHLPYITCGRNPRYLIDDLARFILENRHCHSGEK